VKKSNDWWPGTRVGQLEMMVKWVDVIPPNIKKWKIPPEDFTNLTVLIDKATLLYHEAQSEKTSTPFVKQECKAAFKELTAAARIFKKQHLTMPPLSLSDWISLGFRVPDTQRTSSGTPEARAAITIFLRGDYELGIMINFTVGSADDPANKGIRIHYSVVGPEEKAPANQEDLRHSFLLTRKRDYIQFTPADGGKTCYMAAQVENKRKKGPWGPMTSKMIPG